MVHVHCFELKSEDKEGEKVAVLQRVSESLGMDIGLTDEDVLVHEVRDVAPTKRMYCASFRLPRRIAFAERPHDT